MKILEEGETGISKIISGCKKHSLTAPEFVEIGDSLRGEPYSRLKN